MQLIDAGMLAFAGYHALKGKVERPLTFQVPRMLRATVREAEDAYLLFWNAERLRKRERWPRYRDRPEIWDEAGREDFETMLDVLSALGAVQYRADGWEADEALAAVSHRLEGSEEVVIRSDDKDFMQLLSEATRMVGRRRGEVRAGDVEEILGVPPAYVADYLALAGDEADGIPRIVVPSKARELIAELGHLREWLDRGSGETAGEGPTADLFENPYPGAAADPSANGSTGEPAPKTVPESVADAVRAARLSRDQLLLNLELVDLSAEAVGAPPEPRLGGWGDLEAARAAGAETGIGWLSDDDLAEEYAVLRKWGEAARERLGV